jgi:hypothetical protein
VREWLTGYFSKLPKKLNEVTAQYRKRDLRTGLRKDRQNTSNIAWSRNATQQRPSIHLFLCFGYPSCTPFGPGPTTWGSFFFQSLYNHWEYFPPVVEAQGFLSCSSFRGFEWRFRKLGYWQALWSISATNGSNPKILDLLR